MFDANQLKEWLLKHDAEKRCYEGFWANLESYRTEYPEECEEYFPNFDKSKVHVEVESIRISYMNYPDLSYNHVRVYMPIRYEGEKIGYYELWLDFDGEVADDYFVID